MPTHSSASDTNQDTLTMAQPTWDGSPNTLPAFVEAIIKYRPKNNPIIIQITAIRSNKDAASRGTKTIFYSVNHVNRYANNEIKNRAGEKGTFRAPVVIDAHATYQTRLGFQDQTKR